MSDLRKNEHHSSAKTPLQLTSGPAKGRSPLERPCDQQCTHTHTRQKKTLAGWAVTVLGFASWWRVCAPHCANHKRRQQMAPGACHLVCTLIYSRNSSPTNTTQAVAPIFLSPRLPGMPQLIWIRRSHPTPSKRNPRLTPPPRQHKSPAGWCRHTRHPCAVIFVFHSIPQSPGLTVQSRWALLCRWPQGAWSTLCSATAHGC